MMEKDVQDDRALASRRYLCCFGFGFSFGFGFGFDFDAA
jgi:hypothetical protein